MKIILVLSAILFVTAASHVSNGTSCECGWRNEETRIIGGVVAGRNEFPWMVAVMVNHTQNGRWLLLCGGSIITPWHVLTAAHCIIAGATYGIVIGNHDLEQVKNVNEINLIEKTIVHKKYSPDEHTSNDIAVLVTTTKIEFSSFIGPVCLPNKKLELDNEIVEVMGWGFTEHNTTSNKLLKLKQKVVPLGNCKILWIFMGILIYPSQICAQGYITGSACLGDSGGPLIWNNPENERYTEVGLVSFGEEGCPGGHVSVYTDVSYYIDWINKIVAETKPDVSTCTGY